MKFNNLFVEDFMAKHPELFDKMYFKSGEGLKYSAVTMLEWLIDYYLQSCAEEQCVNNFLLESGAGSVFSTHFTMHRTQRYGGIHLHKIWDTLCIDLNVEKLSTTKILESVSYEILFEKYDTLQDAARNSIDALLPLIQILPDGAFADVISDWAVRASHINTKSLYNDDDYDIEGKVRFSDHWNRDRRSRTVQKPSEIIPNRWYRGFVSHLDEDGAVWMLGEPYEPTIVTDEMMIYRINALIHNIFHINKQKTKELQTALLPYLHRTNQQKRM